MGDVWVRERRDKEEHKTKQKTTAHQIQEATDIKREQVRYEIIGGHYNDERRLKQKEQTKEKKNTQVGETIRMGSN